LHITVNHFRFCGHCHAAQTETEGCRAFVHETMSGHARVFRMLDHGEIQLSARAQGLAHDGLV